ncbi:MAG: NAD(P)/FAD-dependent oxidoreductase [Coprobacillaceae bacterium]
MLQINNVKIQLHETEYVKKISQLLNMPKGRIHNVKLVKQAVDARRKNQIHFICSFTFEVDKEEQILKRYPKLQLQKVMPYEYLKGTPVNKSIVVVGSGPAGLFCAYQLVRSGQKVTMIERGESVQERQNSIDAFFQGEALNPESNIQFGEGGAGTFSDGKLTTGVKDKRKRFVLETFVKHGATEDILYKNKPHVGTDYLRNVVKNMREYIISNGGKVLFNTKLKDIVIKNNKINTIIVETKSGEETIAVDKLVLAIGHSARDTYEMLYERGVHLEQKPFAVGLRIEHLQSFIDSQQYGKFAGHPRLPTADYKLAVKTRTGRGVYTFCMCPGGEVVNASSEEQQLVVNGMSNHARDKENANSAILVTVDGSDFNSDTPLAGIEFQRNLEKKAYMLGGNTGTLPVQRVEDYLEDTLTLEIGNVKPTVLPRVQLAPLHTLFSKEIHQALQEGLTLMNQKINGFTTEAIITGVESRSSAPVRILRNQDYQTNIEGLYPIGEGAGYAGGIMSSAIDGLKCAEIILIK